MFGQLHQVFGNIAPNIASYLVIAGGGGGNNYGGGAGAGGYRNSYNDETSGGNSSAETPIVIATGTAYTITVGAGSAGTPGGGAYAGTSYGGSNSTFHNITSTGGGGGGGALTLLPGNGGSGGGEGFWDSANNTTYYGTGISGQGFRGGRGWGNNDPTWGMGGGGGAGQVGQRSASGGTPAGDGGDGLASSITGTSITRAGGGAGGAWENRTGGTGGSGGGGNGGRYTLTSGSANTGGGGGGSGSSGQSQSATATGGSGGSGVVILRYNSSFTATYTNGLTVSSSTDGNDKIDQITAGTGSVTFTSGGGGGATNAVLNNSWRAWDSNSFTNGGTSCTDVTNGLVLGPYSSGSPGAFFYGSYNNVSGNKYWVLNGGGSHGRRAGFTRPTEFSVSYWGNKPNNPGFNAERGVWAFNAFGTNNIRLVRRNNSNTQSLRIYSGNSAIATFADGMSLSTWYNITTTFSTDTVKTYIGAEGSSTTTLVNETTLSSGTFPTGVTNNGSSGFWIGCTPDYKNWLTDSWSSLSIYDGVMPKSQIDTVVSDGYQQ